MLRQRSFFRSILTSILALAAFVVLAHAQTTLVPAGATWKYLDNGSNQGTAWRDASFVDSTWASGPAQLGYGDGDEATVVSFGPNSSAKYITTYFRHAFNVTNPAAFTSLNLQLKRDDGAVVYLNGTEVYRSNMPTGTISYTTPASAAASDDGGTWLSASLSSSLLVSGANVLAVEIHQSSGTSSDISFDLLLSGSSGVNVTRGPYLQMNTPASIIVRWRTDVATNSRVSYGSSPAMLTQTADDLTSTTEHVVTVSGLSPNQTYYYSIGTTTSALVGADANHFFKTSPVAGTAAPTRIWVLGDAGTANASQTSVRNAYYTFAGSTYTNLILMLGDNAYNSGTDSEYQNAVFNMYPTILRQTPLWSTLGNHDTASSTNPPATLPYYQMFTFPQNAEVGGFASGTEDYYSFNYGNIHFVCLDSMTSARTAGSPMLMWLQNDLAANTKEWIIAFWHHPPYTKGSHDSDTENQLIEMRQNVLPILEAHGVDLVLTGHSHSYERSFLIDGHYGSSSTFTNSMKKNGGDGRPTGNGAYTKATLGPSGHEGAVYVVAGSSGQISGGTLNHPAMFISLNNLGSMVLDFNGNQLDAKFLRETGAIADSFTIIKGVTPNAPPTASLTNPTNGATFTAPANITIDATASDSDGSVTQVQFYQGTTLLGTDTTAPYQFVWSSVAAGSYSLTVKATDNQGAATTSSAVNITVNANTPTAPTNLTATAVSRSQINLTWTDNSSNETGFKIERSTNGTSFTQIATVGAGVTSYASTGLQKNRTYYYRVRATNGAGDSAYSNVASARTFR
jgi:hypothetical protein